MSALFVRRLPAAGRAAPAGVSARGFSRRPALRGAAAWPGPIRAAAALIILFVLLPGPAAGQVVRGRVIDARSGGGVELARVVVSGTGQRSRAITAADGRFSVRLRRGGSFRVQVARAGYAETRTRALAVGARDTVDVDVRITPVALPLDPVTVTARARRLRVTGVFNEISDYPIARASVVGKPRSVAVRGWFPTPDFCHHLAGNADRRESIITLTVQARATDGPCPEGTGSLFYNVTVRRLPPGSYTFRVLHAFQDGIGEPSLVLDTAVTVR